MFSRPATMVKVFPYSQVMADTSPAPSPSARAMRFGNPIPSSAIAKELATQYALGYTPKALRPDGRFRRIVVQVTDRPQMRIRTRAGYTAARRPATAPPLE